MPVPTAMKFDPAKDKIIADLFRRAGPPPADTAQLGPFRAGETYRYRMANGCKRKYRVIRIYLGSFFGPKPSMLVEYLDSKEQRYIDPALAVKTLV